MWSSWLTPSHPLAVECFFCLSTSLLPSTKDLKGHGGSQVGVPGGPLGSRWNWMCDHCGCMNIRDGTGEMLSDVPAMHDTARNERSFSLKAQPSVSHLPSTSSSSTSPFCRECTTNQSMIMNLLANYLPADDDPNYASLYDDLPHYVASLNQRYPPVCYRCQPDVEDALRKADQKAQGEAWSYALKRGSEREKSNAGEREEVLAVLVWKLRGALFCVGTGLSLFIGLTAWVSPDWFRGCLQVQILSLPLSASHLLWTSNLLSIGWIVWDPYWLRTIRSGDKVKISGRDTWIRDMLLVLATRFMGLLCLGVTGSLACTRIGLVLEIILLLHALTSLRIHQPVTLTLVRPVSITGPSHINSAEPIEPPHLSYLSLENDPKPKATSNPIFGHPSLQQVHHGHAREQPEPMDWEPIPISPTTSQSGVGRSSRTRPRELDSDGDSDAESEMTTYKADWNAFGVGRQRMFPKSTIHDQTGLESLFAGWGTEQATEPVAVNGVSHEVAASSGGLVLDKLLVQKLNLGLAVLRFFGAIIVVLSISLGTEAVRRRQQDSFISGANSFVSNLEVSLNILHLVITAKSVGSTQKAVALGAVLVGRIMSVILSRYYGEVFIMAGNLGVGGFTAGCWALWGTADLMCAQS